MNFNELILKRESCRNYSEKKVSREILCEMIKFGMLAPSACNSQPWRFIGVDEEEKVEFLRKNVQYTGSNRWADCIPAFIIVSEIPAQLRKGIHLCNQHFAQIDVGIAVANLTLAATSLGLSTCIMGIFDEDEIKKEFGIPDEVRVRLILAVGYGADETPRSKIRKNFEDAASFNKW